MNNAQLDMILNFLNEGININSDEFFIESLNEFVEQSIYESNQIISLLEADKLSGFEKIKESIKKFINWIKTLITKLRIKIKQLSVNVLAKVLEKNISSQKEIAKDLDPNSEITINPIENLILFSAESLVGLEKEALFNVYDLSKEKMKNLKEQENIAGIIIKMINNFGKLPMPLLFMSVKFSDFISKSTMKSKGLEEADKESRTITLQQYLNQLDSLKSLGEKCKNILEETLKIYDEEIKLANELYRQKELVSGNEYLSDVTKITRFSVDLTSAALKCITLSIALSKKPIKNLKKLDKNSNAKTQ